MEATITKNTRQRSMQYSELCDWARICEKLNHPLQVKADKGHLFVNLQLPSTKTLLVDVGLGIYAEVTIAEAVSIASARSGSLVAEADKFEQESTQRAACDLARAHANDWALQNGLKQ